VHIVDALSKGETPTEFLKPVMVNLMYIVNEYRPHQAREDLVQALKNQVEAKRALVLAVRAHIEEARLELAKALATTQPPSAPTGPAQDLVLDREFEKYLP
jgi:mediator of RNA polymerase II transcription subunit 7